MRYFPSVENSLDNCFVQSKVSVTKVITSVQEHLKGVYKISISKTLNHGVQWQRNIKMCIYDLNGNYNNSSYESV